MTRPTISAATAAAAMLFSTSPALAAPTTIAGQWATDDGKAIVEIYPCAAKLCGRILRLLIAEPAGGQRDERNPDKELRDRKLQGMRIYWDLVADDKGWKGQGYSPEDGRYYKANLHRNGNRMNMKGCVAIFCRTVTWTRLK